METSLLRTVTVPCDRDGNYEGYDRADRVETVGVVSTESERFDERWRVGVDGVDHEPEGQISLCDRMGLLTLT